MEQSDVDVVEHTAERDAVEVVGSNVEPMAAGSELELECHPCEVRNGVSTHTSCMIS